MKPEYDGNFKTIIADNKIKIKADNVLAMIGDQVLLEVSDETGTISAQLFIKVVSLYG